MVPGKDSNLHGFHRWYLKPVRLPIPPPGHGRIFWEKQAECQWRAAASLRKPDQHAGRQTSSMLVGSASRCNRSAADRAKRSRSAGRLAGAIRPANLASRRISAP